MGIGVLDWVASVETVCRVKVPAIMAMPYSKINIGDVFESPLKWTGSDITYTVVDKADGMVEVRSSYQHPALPETLWKKPSDMIFTRRVVCGVT